MKKKLKKAEEQISLIEAAVAAKVSRVFRDQREIITQSIPEEFDEQYLVRAAGKAELETYLAFKDVLIGTGILAANVCIRGPFKDLALQDGEIGFSGYRVSFDIFVE